MGPGSTGRACPTLGLSADCASLSPGDTAVLPPLRPQHAESRNSAGRRPDTAPACFLDPAATYNTTLTAPIDSGSACAVLAQLAEWGARR
jgi:hypothetical protein